VEGGRLCPRGPSQHPGAAHLAASHPSCHGAYEPAGKGDAVQPDASLADCDSRRALSSFAFAAYPNIANSRMVAKLNSYVPMVSTGSRATMLAPMASQKAAKREGRLT